MNVRKSTDLAGRFSELSRLGSEPSGIENLNTKNYILYIHATALMGRNKSGWVV